MFTLAMSPRYSSYKSFFYDLFPHGGDGHTGNTLNTMANQSAIYESATVNVDQAAVHVLLNNPLTVARRGSHTVTFVCILISLYICIHLALVVYRLSSFHPLAKVPGPRLARATRWYQTYYEIFKGGRMTEELQRLHNIYGPVVRYGPNDLHFSSPNAYHTIYNTKAKVTKDPWLYKCFSQDQSTFGYTNPEDAKIRRHQILPFFSKRTILALQGVIVENLNTLHRRLATLEHDTGNEIAVVDLGSAIRSLTMDVIMSFCFGESLNTLSHETFRHPVIQFLEETLPLLWVFKHFPVIQTLMLATPEWVSERMGAHGIVLLKRNITQQLDRFLESLPSPAHDIKENGITTGTTGARPKEIIFHRLLDSDHRPIASRQSLFDEAQALIVAGSDTTANTISVGAFHILSNPDVHDRLRAELQEVWPGGELSSGLNARPGWEQLEKLPYLTAVIKESLRLSHGVVSPLSRIVPAEGLMVDGMFVPPRTIVASSAPFLHLNPTLFPSPTTFNPNRWLSSEAAPGLDKHIAAFSHGPRSCAGVNLAWCELYLTFAMLFRKFDFELVGTSAEDITYRGYFVPLLNGKIKVSVRQRRD